MNILQKYIPYCEYTKEILGVHATLIDFAQKRFACVPFYDDNGVVSGCNAYNTHLYGAYQAQSQLGWYYYTCPRGLIFIALPIIKNSTMDYCLIIGPIILEGEPNQLEGGCSHSLKGVPTFSRKQIEQLGEWLSYSVPDYKHDFEQIDLSLFGGLSEGVFRPGYSVETLGRLFASIRGGNKTLAKELLEEILTTLFSVLSDDYNGLRWQIIELFIRMSRAAVKGGAEKDKVIQFCVSHLREADKIKDIDTYREWIQSALEAFLDFVFNLEGVKHKNVVFETNEYIKAHLTDKILLEEAAANVCLSKSYFCKIISKELGYTFTELLNRIRVEQSRKYLEKKDLSIAQVAQSVGFEDQSYYTKCFRKITGVTPAQYRKNKV